MAIFISAINRTATNYQENLKKYITNNKNKTANHHSNVSEFRIMNYNSTTPTIAYKTIDIICYNYLLEIENSDFVHSKSTQILTNILFTNK